MFSHDYSLLDYMPYAIKYSRVEESDKVRYVGGVSITDSEIYITAIERTYHSRTRGIATVLTRLETVYNDCFKEMEPLYSFKIDKFLQLARELETLGCINTVPSVEEDCNGITLRRIIKEMLGSFKSQVEFYNSLLKPTEDIYFTMNPNHANEVRSKEAVVKLEEFNKYFTSENDSPRDTFIKVSRTEWEELYKTLKELI